MKILFLNDSSLLRHGLASGFPLIDEIRYLPVHLANWEECLINLLRTWKPDFALAGGRFYFHCSPKALSPFTPQCPPARLLGYR